MFLNEYHINLKLYFECMDFSENDFVFGCQQDRVSNCEPNGNSLALVFCLSGSVLPFKNINKTNI